MRRADMLVKLYNLDDDWSFLAEQRGKGITIRKPLGGEKSLIVEWVAGNFSRGWADEAERAVLSGPATCFVAIRDGRLIGFCCYDATARGFCGPLGVEAAHSGCGTGRALLLACLLDMKLNGHGYAIIGWVEENSFDFYKKAAGAVEIPDSFPGMYETYLRRSGRS